MDEPPLTIYREEYTPPEAFPARKSGAWHSEAAYPIARTQLRTLYLGAGTLQEPRTENWAASNVSSPLSVDEERWATDNGQRTTDTYPHRPTHGTRAALCWGAGGAPNGLARDLRPDEALIPTYTSAPLTEGLDVIGFPEAILYLSSTAPVAHVVVRLTDVTPDGVSAMVSAGVLNLTHRESHAEP
ncbi:MAG TPA: CocE/NonD family hydrolase, partial [Roseiflexaceae bacterium]